MIHLSLRMPAELYADRPDITPVSSADPILMAMRAAVLGSAANVADRSVLGFPVDTAAVEGQLGNN